MPPRELPPRLRSVAPGLDPQDFDAIRDAVMETSRGRWFLDEYASRLRQAETAALEAGMRRLEAAMASNHDEIMSRLATVLAQPAAADWATAPAAEPPAPPEDWQLAPRHMRYYRADEELFEPAPEATIAAVPRLIDTLPAEAEAPQPKRQRIIITRRKPGEPFEVPLAEELPKAS